MKKISILLVFSLLFVSCSLWSTNEELEPTKTTPEKIVDSDAPFSVGPTGPPSVKGPQKEPGK